MIKGKIMENKRDKVEEKKFFNKNDLFEASIYIKRKIEIVGALIFTFITNTRIFDAIYCM